MGHQHPCSTQSKSPRGPWDCTASFLQPGSRPNRRLQTIENTILSGGEMSRGKTDPIVETREFFSRRPAIERGQSRRHDMAHGTILGEYRSAQGGSILDEFHANAAGPQDLVHPGEPQLLAPDAGRCPRKSGPIPGDYRSGSTRTGWSRPRRNCPPWSTAASGRRGIITRLNSPRPSLASGRCSST